MTKLLTKPVVALVDVTAVTDRALVSFVDRSAKKTTDRFLDFSLVRYPKWSFARNSKSPGM